MNEEQKAEKGIWFSYDWQHEGIPSLTQVNCHYYDDKRARDRLPHLFFLRLSSNPKKSQRLSPLRQSFLKRSAAQIEKAAKVLGLELVGRRTIGSELELYFYSPNQANAEALEEKIRKKRLQMNTRLMHDPSWQMYFHGVYPSMAQRQSVLNEENCQKMAKSGDNIHSVRRINYYLNFPNNISRSRFAEEARKSGFAISEDFYTPEDDFALGCIVLNRSSLELKDINRHTTLLCMLAEKHQGSFVHWDCPTIKKFASLKNKPIPPNKPGQRPQVEVEVLASEQEETIELPQQKEHELFEEIMAFAENKAEQDNFLPESLIEVDTQTLQTSTEHPAAENPSPLAAETFEVAEQEASSPPDFIKQNEARLPWWRAEEAARRQNAENNKTAKLSKEAAFPQADKESADILNKNSSASTIDVEEDSKSTAFPPNSGSSFDLPSRFELFEKKSSEDK